LPTARRSGSPHDRATRHNSWPTNVAVTRRRVQYLALFFVLSLASFAVGTRILVSRQAPLTHPLTGRQIAGIATDAGWLDRGAREQEEEPDRALDLIGITPGSVVADIGAGTGYMTVRLAQRVGAAGKVYANDVQPAMLRILQEKLRTQQLSNVEIVEGTDADPHLPDNAIDLALLVDVYHEFAHPQEMLRSIRRSLKPNGRLILVEYRKEDPRIPIAPTHRMSVAEARTEVEAEGFRFDRVIAGLPRQHIIVFLRPAPQPSPEDTK
jgi:SAM-dependent methyltransferase